MPRGKSGQNKRLESLADILQKKLALDEEITKQESLITDLKHAGHHISPSQLSRDLNELKETKGLSIVNHKVRLDVVPEPYEQEYKSLLRKNPVITEPYLLGVQVQFGYERRVSYLFDKLYRKEVYGTLEGRRAVLLLCKSPASKRRLEHRIKRIMEMEDDPIFVDNDLSDTNADDVIE